MAVLSGLGSVLAVRCSLVGLVVDLRAECMSELFRGAAAFLTQVVALSEVIAQVPVVTAGSDTDISFTSRSPHLHQRRRRVLTCSIPESRLRHRSGRSSGPCAGVSAARRCPGNGRHRTCRAGVLCGWCRPGLRALGAVPAPSGYTTSSHGRRSGGRRGV